MNVVIIGTGYVGLVSGLGLAKLGHRVACVDTNEDKIRMLDMGEPPFFEPSLVELLTEMQNSGHIVFTSNLSEVLVDAEIIILAVGTPPGPNGEADLSYLFTAAESIGQTLEHEAIVVIKSTVPVGTNRQVIDRIRTVMSERGRDDLCPLVQIASVPEFLREGNAISDFQNPDRVVIGCDDDIIFMILDRLHDGINGPRLMMSIESAELTKYAANAFLATKISFINEIANIAERTGANVLDVAKSIGLDKRIGPHFLKAGLGYGGSCFPKDVSALRQLAGVKGYDFKLLSAVIEANNRQRENFFKKIESRLNNLKGRQLAVWGLAFKNNTDDIRESAAIDLVQRLYARGAQLTVYDPQAMDNARLVLPEGINFAGTPIDAATGAEALLVLTEWPEFRQVSFPTLLNSMVEPKIFDGRNLLADLDLSKWGFEYHGVGL